MAQMVGPVTIQYSPYAEINEYVLRWESNPAYRCVDFILQRHHARDFWRCSVSDETIVSTRNREDIYYHVAMELGMASGLTVGLIYDTLQRYCGLWDGASHYIDHRSYARIVQQEPVWMDMEARDAQVLRLDYAIGIDWAAQDLFSVPSACEYEGDKGNERAKELFLSHLTDTQKSRFEKSKTFDCVGVNTGLTYTIHYGRVVNVTRQEEDGSAQRYCLVQRVQCAAL